MTSAQTQTSGCAIAIIGMGCIFPESENLKAYWQLIFNGKDAISSIPEDSHWKLSDFHDPDPAKPDHTYCRRGGFIPRIAFNPLSYGIPPNNLQATDTSQLLGLEVARMALEDAGYPIGDPRLQTDKVNVILGVTGTQELVIPLGARLGHPYWKQALATAGVDQETRQRVLDHIQSSYVQWQENSFPGLLGNVVAGRIANRLNLSGTNAVSDAACASSLSAIHTAIMELASGRCDMSITGGVDTLNDIFMHMCFSKTGVLSHTSDARPFSKEADGTVLGEGIGLLVLKRLADAEKDKNRIYAVIRGMGTSSDGRTSAIYAPEAQGQVRALKDAYDRAGVDPSTVDLVEAHGTGTRVGDKVEFTALKQCFDPSGRHQSTAIGSVKSMIGHTKAAAGAAGMIKAALALHHKIIPPTLKAGEPDPDLDICNSPFYLNTLAKPWVLSEENARRRSGVSAFGFGGSNFHAVLEEYTPEKTHVSWDGSLQIFAFSARDAVTLDEKIKACRNTLAAFDTENRPALARAVAWQAGESRKTFSAGDEFRLLALFRQGEDVFALLDNAQTAAANDAAPKAPIFMGKGKAAGKLGFLFPGQGSQYPGMARELMSVFPEGARALGLAQQIKQRMQQSSSTGIDLLTSAIYPLPEYAQDKKKAEETLRQTQTAQPAIGAVSMALTGILRRFGVCPDICCGHSFGELAALHAAGWLSPEDFLALSVARGHYMAQAGNSAGDAGSMLAVQAPLAKIKTLIEEEGLNLILANENSPSQGVLSGATGEIDRAVQCCRARKMRAVKLPVAAAFHSTLVANAAGPFQEQVARKPFTPTEISVLSNTTGGEYPLEDQAVKALLGSQLVHPVRFIDNIETMQHKGVSTFIEVGPKPVLSGLVKNILKNEPVTIQAMDEPGAKTSGLFNLARVLCTIAAQGHAVDLTAWEEAAAKPELPKMAIMLNGANPKPATKTKTDKVPAGQKPSTVLKKIQEAPVASNPQGSAMTPNPYLTLKPEAAPQTSALPKPEFPVRTVSYPGAQTGQVTAPSASHIQLLQKGLEAMQKLQEQTARAHEKFLETQTQASKTLAEIMAQTRGQVPPQTVAPQAPPIYQAPRQPEVPAPVPTVYPSPAVPAGPVSSQPQTFAAAAPVAPVTQADQVSPSPQATSQAATPLTVPPSAAPILFDIVSRLTGFPVEMLEPQMDIESDLGIDSIKKVEIISELEKALPGGHSLSSDHLTTVRTLEDICTAIAGTQSPTPRTDAVKPIGVAAPAAAPAASQDRPGATGASAQTMAVLVKVISDLTGFPEDMLEPGMNLESDLGIDSIKRVEILSRLEQELPDMRTIAPDDMGSLKTLENIVSFLTQGNEPAQDGPAKKKTPSATETDALTGTGEAAAEAGHPLSRQTVVLKTYPTNQIRFYNGARIDVSTSRTIYLTRDSSGIAEALAAAFKKQGLKTALLDLSEDMEPELGDAAGLVIIPDPFQAADNQDAKAFLARAFDLARQCGKTLMDAAEQRSAFFATLTFSGGSFGFRSHDPGINPIYGGLAGLAKTADIEWKKVLCHAMDLPADPERCRQNAEAVAALMLTHGAVEMGIDGEHCYIPEMEKTPVKAGELLLTPKDVVVISGGAKGVTAACALALAQTCAPKIVLLGRSPAPFEEPNWLIPLQDAGKIKQAILKNEFSGQKPKPADLQDRYQVLMSNREVAANLKQIAQFSAIVRYVQVDIRDKAGVKDAILAVSNELGPISALIHGAGILEDKLIVEKQPEKFRRVFDTKVDGLFNLLAATEGEPLRHVVLFSSVAARFGNQGQCDYAMANEVLNKVAQSRARIGSACRYLSINWGPWDGGMVDEGLKKEFSKRGIDLIPITAGARQMVTEMAGADNRQVEIVIGASLKTRPREKAPVLTRALSQMVGPTSTPVICDHRIDHQPVVPLAMIADLLASAAEKNNPGLCFAGIDRMYLLKGIVARDGDLSIQVLLGRCSPRTQGHGFTVSARLASPSEDREVPHAEGTILLKEKLPAPPVLSKAAFMDLKPARITADQAYDQVLFHGPAFQCIKSINGISPKGIEITAQCGPDIQTWYATPQAKHWTLDPLLLDAAFQAAILWTYENRQAVCLPNAMDSLRLYASYPTHEGDVRILFTVSEETGHKIQGYFTFLDTKGTVIASIMGFEALTDERLLEKFKPRPLFDRDKILAFAQGLPSQAFGTPYAVFDKDREIARLPRPPYFFMDRVNKADHPQWEMKPGGWIETAYEIPAKEWYFAANRSQAMPFCILLEIALQPCGWLAAYAGSALHSENRLHFRNLGGKATLFENLWPQSGTLTIRSRMTEVSKAGGMIIQNFDMEMLNRGKRIYQGTTNFGFFTQEALSNQIGIRKSRYFLETTPTGPPLVFGQDSPVTPDDSQTGPNNGMPSTALRMVDRIDLLDFDGGIFGKGLVAGTKIVNPAEWFFDAHFYQDPVCPGSLGVESFLQLMRYFMIKKFDIDPNRYEIRLSEQSTHEWVYRGQIIPANKQIEVQAHISECEADADHYQVQASGALRVDGICIYEMKDFSIACVPVTVPAGAKAGKKVKKAG